MELTVYRYSETKKDTLGILKDENKEFFCYVIEDEKRERNAKVKRETRIWDGRYKLGIRKENTPLTKKHRDSYNSYTINGVKEDWFEYHIEILNIPDFIGCYIHAGSHEGHTEGCPLLGDAINNNQLEIGKFSPGTSITAVKRFYKKYYPLLEKGEEIYINFITLN